MLFLSRIILTGFSSELPVIGTEFMVWELLFNVAKGDGILLLPSFSGCIPPSPLSLISHPYGPVSCARIPRDFPALFLHGDLTVLVDVPWELWRISMVPIGAELEGDWGLGGYPGVLVPWEEGGRRGLPCGLCGRGGTQRIGSQHPGRRCQAPGGAAPVPGVQHHQTRP